MGMNPDDSKFCNQCGTSLKVEPPIRKKIPSVVKCKFCDFENPGYAKFCNECGTDLSAVPTTKIMEKKKDIERFKKCIHCGKSNPVDGRFCNSCGVPLRVEKPPIGIRKTITPPPVMRETYYKPIWETGGKPLGETSKSRNGGRCATAGAILTIIGATFNFLIGASFAITLIYVSLTPGIRFTISTDIIIILSIILLCIYAIGISGSVLALRGKGVFIPVMGSIFVCVGGLLLFILNWQSWLFFGIEPTILGILGAILIVYGGGEHTRKYRIRCFRCGFNMKLPPDATEVECPRCGAMGIIEE